MSKHAGPRQKKVPTCPPTPQRVKAAEARRKAFDRVGPTLHERVVLTRRGKDVAAVIPLDDLARLEELENASDVRAARKARKEKGAVRLGTIKARLGMR